MDDLGDLFPLVLRQKTSNLVALGGDLLPDRLLAAYKKGIFPWYSEDEPVLWWSPDPRFVLFPSELRVSHSMKPLLKKRRFRVTVDTQFATVIVECARIKRHGQFGTWITSDMLEAYIRLHNLGFAHSVEVWDGDALVGGLYGLGLGRVFFGESMFARASNASKYGFITLVQWLESRSFVLIDCQQETEHLGSLGARPIPRSEFRQLLDRYVQPETESGGWTNNFEEWKL